MDRTDHFADVFVHHNVAYRYDIVMMSKVHS